VNIYHEDQPALDDLGESMLQYLDELSLPVSGTEQTYFLGCSGAATAHALIEGTETLVDCGGTDNLSRAFLARAIATLDGSVRLFRPRRFVF
jgi:hypothetical protein